MDMQHQSIADRINSKHPLGSRMGWVCFWSYLLMWAMAGGFVAGYAIGSSGVS